MTRPDRSGKHPGPRGRAGSRPRILPVVAKSHPLLLSVLVVEDDAQIIETIILCLRPRWPDLRMIATPSGLDAIRLVQSSIPDIILLDLTLSDLYGLHVLKEIRTSSDAPVVIITANSEEIYRLRSFQMGTTDYLLKPFSHLDLLGSVNASLKRPAEPARPSQAPPGMEAGLVIDLVGHRVLREGIEIGLSALQWKVLTLLLQNHSRPTTYRELAEIAWGTEAGNLERSSMDLALRQLQLKLGDDPQQPEYLTTSQAGYRLAIFPPLPSSGARPGRG